MKLPIYLDSHATTPVDPEVLAAMLPYFTEVFGNPSSRGHRFGWQAEEAVELARESVAALLGTDPSEIIFTSGATEANNFALKGVARTQRNNRNQLITVATEHPSVLETCRRLEADGFEITVLPVNSDGLLDLDRLAGAVSDRTLLVSVMYAQNEIGVIQPIRDIARLAHDRGALLHTDAAQFVGNVPINVPGDGIDLLALSGHKLYGPKGVGALFCRRGSIRTSLTPLIDGGGQERGLRSGTLNVPGIVGLGAAARIAGRSIPQESPRVSSLRDRLALSLTAELDGIRINGSLEHRLPNNLSVSFDQVDGESLMMSLRDIAVSNGSACSSAAGKPSHVLEAIGVHGLPALATLRFGLGRNTTEPEIDHAAACVIDAVKRLRSGTVARIAGHQCRIQPVQGAATF